MNVPFGILFLKKAELYNLVKRFDEQEADIADKLAKNKKSRIPSTWPIEKNIFEWSYDGHKHLGTPLTPDHFKPDNPHNKLKDWKLCKDNCDDKKCELEESYKQIIKYNKPKKIFENMVIKGFADSDKESKGIILNKEGLLLGEVIYNVNNRKPRVERIYKIYSWLMDYGGAWILLIFVILTIIMTWFVNLWNIFS